MVQEIQMEGQTPHLDPPEDGFYTGPQIRLHVRRPLDFFVVLSSTSGFSSCQKNNRRRRTEFQSVKEIGFNSETVVKNI